jgi:ribosomal protein L40E
MLSPRCLFCDGVNPADAKFCNHCGSSLHVKQCARCKAVNDEAATTCLKCRTNFRVQSTGSMVPPMSSGRDSAAPSQEFNDPLPFRLSSIFDEVKLAPSAAKATADAPSSIGSEAALASTSSTAPQRATPGAAIEPSKFGRAFDSERSNFEEPTPSMVAGSDSAHPPEPEPGPAPGSQPVSERWPGNDTAMTRGPGAEIATREARTLGGDVPSLSSTAQRIAPQSPPSNLEATAESRPTSRVTRTVALATLALTAVGVLGYYVYSESLQPNEGQGAQAVSGSSVASGTEKPPPPVEPPTSATGSTVSQAATAASDSTGAAGQLRQPNDPPRQISTSDQASPGQESATKTEGAITRPGAPAAEAGDVRDQAISAAGNEISAKRSGTNPPVRRYPASGVASPVQSPPGGDRSSARTDAPSSRACTEGVAALGLCTLNSAGESKISAGESK